MFLNCHNIQTAENVDETNSSQSFCTFVEVGSGSNAGTDGKHVEESLVILVLATMND